MRKLLLRTLALFLVLSFGTGPLSGQKQPTIQELNAQISKAEEDIKRSQQLLGKIKKDKSTTQSELKLILSRIASRQKLVSSLGEQINLLDREITEKTGTVSVLEEQSGALKQEYADMIYSAYKSNLVNNSTAFIFASEDFNDATRRIDYMRRYNSAREKKIVEIDSLTNKIDTELQLLARQREQLEKTKKSRDGELKLLRNDESGYKQSSRKLAAEEKKVANAIKQKEKEKKNAEAQLRKIISEETKKSSSRTLSAEDARRIAELSGRFDQNQGKFPYPVQGGVIIDGYGKHPHPTQKGLTIDNKGVNIMAEKGASVRCLFEGTVMRVVFIKGLNNCVMIQHGDYFTVYSNLASVAVKPNDKVKTNQVIGTIPGGEDSDDYYIHFELWKGTTNLNPQRWFYR